MAYTTIKKPSDYFNTKLWSGNSTTSTGITGVGFQPDLVWIKRRSGVENHVWNDAVRGVPNNIYSSSTNAEDSGSLMSAILSDGFTVQTDPSVNSNTDTYVAWNWLGANGTASNSDGSITSTVSANTTSGFSIATYTGNNTNAQTIGHGLGVAPKVYIIKRRDSTSAWGMYHGSLGANKYLQLESTNAEATDTGIWNNTAPTSSVLSIGNAGYFNNVSGGTYVCYAFAEVKGFSKFGSYVGNASLDGTFIYTGFKPSWVIIKRTDVINSWVMFDNKRNGTYGLSGNPRARHLYANTSDPEDSADNYNQVDFVSNGFKLREDNTTINASGGSYIYMAFAEEPLVGDNPCTAR